MELKEFIQNVIEDIFAGVEAVQKSTENMDCVVNPYTVEKRDSAINQTERTFEKASLIEFEVVLTNSENKGGTAGIGVFLGGVSIGAKGDKETNTQHLTSIKFSIPVIYPCNPEGE